MSGYAHIHRRLLGHPVFRNDAEAMAFAWLIIKAAWKPTRVRYKDKIITLARGHVAVSVRDFATAMDRNKAWIERLLKRLKSEAMIETSDETGVSVISICNYDDYQGQRDSGETPRKTPSETGAGQSRDTEQEEEELEEDKIPPIAPQGAVSGKTLIPEDWQAPTVEQLPPKARACAEKWPTEAYETEAEAFVCYWRSRRRMMADWRLTWANRIIDQHDRVMRRVQSASFTHRNGASSGQRNFEDVVLEERQRRQHAAGG